MFIEIVLWTKILINSKAYEFIRFSIIIAWIRTCPVMSTVSYGVHVYLENLPACVRGHARKLERDSYILLKADVDCTGCGDPCLRYVLDEIMFDGYGAHALAVLAVLAALFADWPRLESRCK